MGPFLDTAAGGDRVNWTSASRRTASPAGDVDVSSWVLSGSRTWRFNSGVGPRYHTAGLHCGEAYFARLTSTCGTNVPCRSLRGVEPTKIIASPLRALIFHFCCALSLIELVARSFRTQMTLSASFTT